MFLIQYSHAKHWLLWCMLGLFGPLQREANLNILKTAVTSTYTYLHMYKLTEQRVAHLDIHVLYKTAVSSTYLTNSTIDFYSNNTNKREQSSWHCDSNRYRWVTRFATFCRELANRIQKSNLSTLTKERQISEQSRQNTLKFELIRRAWTSDVYCCYKEISRVINLEDTPITFIYQHKRKSHTQFFSLVFLFLVLLCGPIYNWHPLTPVPTCEVRLFVLTLYSLCPHIKSCLYQLTLATACANIWNHVYL